LIDVFETGSRKELVTDSFFTALRKAPRLVVFVLARQKREVRDKSWIKDRYVAAIGC
jgi:hypothetical protein